MQLLDNKLFLMDFCLDHLSMNGHLVFDRAEQLDPNAIYTLGQKALRDGQKGLVQIFFSYLESQGYIEAKCYLFNKEGPSTIN